MVGDTECLLSVLHSKWFTFILFLIFSSSSEVSSAADLMVKNIKTKGDEILWPHTL